VARPPALLVLALAAVAIATASVGVAGATPTSVSVQCLPGPLQCHDWHRGPVTVKWLLPDATDTLLDSCVLQTLHADTPGTKLGCTAWVGTLLTGTTSVETVIRIDATPPTAAATTDRPLDHGAWFNHPVGIHFHGSDATSGVASCSSAVYGGPDGPGITVAGSCQDVAGNVGAGALALNYDATPPPAPQVVVRPENKAVKLDWSASPDAEAVEVVRLPRAATPAAVLFRGGGDGFTDRRLRNQARYRYAVTAVDRAGNRAQTVVDAVPTASPLLSPARDAHLHSAPLLLWKPVKRAAYYNVQLYRGKRKLLSRWPRGTQLQLDGSWRFGRRNVRLVPGHYRWYVWPGYGPRAERRYGKRLGTSAFTVVR
jgi:hypothetical protein